MMSETTTGGEDKPRVPFHPMRCTTSDDALVEFIRSPIGGKLDEVPGMSASNVEQLAKGDETITNTYQLIGKFLALSPNESDVVEHCNQFKYWLQLKNVRAGSLNNIVQAIAKKVGHTIPGVYDEVAFFEEV